MLERFAASSSSCLSNRRRPRSAASGDPDSTSDCRCLTSVKISVLIRSSLTQMEKETIWRQENYYYLWLSSNIKHRFFSFFLIWLLLISDNSAEIILYCIFKRFYLLFIVILSWIYFKTKDFCLKSVLSLFDCLSFHQTSKQKFKHLNIKYLTTSDFRFGLWDSDFSEFIWPKWHFYFLICSSGLCVQTHTHTFVAHKPAVFLLPLTDWSTNSSSSSQSAV